MNYTPNPSPQALGAAMMPVDVQQAQSPQAGAQPPSLSPQQLLQMAQMGNRGNTGTYNPSGTPSVSDQFASAQMNPNASTAYGSGLTGQFANGIMGLGQPGGY